MAALHVLIAFLDRGIDHFLESMPAWLFGYLLWVAPIVSTPFWILFAVSSVTWSWLKVLAELLLLILRVVWLLFLLCMRSLWGRLRRAIWGQPGSHIE